MNELRFNIFTFIALLSKNIRQITFIIFLSLSCGVFYYISSDYKYTVKANLVSLEPIQNSLTSIGFTDTELFNLFLYNIYNKELIRSSYIALEEDINVENADSDEFIYKLTKSLRIERGENKDVDIIYQDEDSSFAEKFLRVHIINVKTETLKSLRTVIEGNIRRNSLKLNSAKMLEDEKKKISLMNLRKSLDLINEFYLDEKENLLNYIEQNIKIAEAMDQILPVEAIISENAQSISNFSKDPLYLNS